MAKCPMCHSRNGKRKCLNTDSFVCSECCGETRNEDNCSTCSFYQQPEIKNIYSHIPRYTPKQMAASMDLQECSNTIEGAFCAFDSEMGYTLQDGVLIKILELLLDKYHFKETITYFEKDKLVEKGFLHTLQAIKEDLPTVPEEKLAKVVGVLYFVAKRRSEGRREYLTTIRELVGERVGTGARVLRY